MVFFMAHLWQIVEANTFGKIQVVLTNILWNNIVGFVKPADSGTRCTLSPELVNCEFRYHGPKGYKSH